MFRKTIFLCVLALSSFCFSVVIHADQYYDQYTGNSFHPQYSSSAYLRSADGTIYHDDIYDEFYFCPVNFSVPDGSTYFIKSIGIRFKDNLDDGYIRVVLRRMNLYTGNWHAVADWSSGSSAADNFVKTASQGTETGVKLIDSKKFAYFLYVTFQRDGSVSPGPNLLLYQVRIHYGT